MDLSASLNLTEKGLDEVKRRMYKLSIRKRSVLILLEQPHTVEHLLQKTVLHRDELMLEIENLVRDGFLGIGGAPSGSGHIAPASATAQGRPAEPVVIPGDGSIFHLDEEIIISEAKFLLTDFCVDSFGTQSQAFVDEISACRSPESLGSCLRNSRRIKCYRYGGVTSGEIGVPHDISHVGLSLKCSKSGIDFDCILFRFICNFTE